MLGPEEKSIYTCEICENSFSGGWGSVCPDFVLPRHPCGLVVPEDDNVIGCDAESCICIVGWAATLDTPQYLVGCLGEIKAVLVAGKTVDWKEWTIGELRVRFFFSNASAI